MLKTQKADDKIRDKIRLTYGVQPYQHNYYNDTKFFQFLRDEGTVTNVYGQRVVRVTEDFILALQAGLEEEVGDAASEIMYKAGYYWGEQDMQIYSARVQQEFEVAFNKMSMGMMLETWWWPLTIEGWGTWRYDFSQGKQGLIFIDLYESAWAKTLGDVGEVVCHFYAGLFAAVMSNLSKRRLAGIEIQCYAMGEDYCKFLIGSEKRVNAASFWRNEGASAKDVMKKIKDID